MPSLSQDADAKARHLGDCAVCMEPMTVGESSEGTKVSASYPCGHLFHTHCLTDWMKSATSAEKACMVCRAPITSTIILNSAVPTLRSRHPQNPGQPAPHTLTANDLAKKKIAELEAKLKKDRKLKNTLESVEEQEKRLDTQLRAMDLLNIKAKAKRGISLVHSYAHCDPTTADVLETLHRESVNQKTRLNEAIDSKNKEIERANIDCLQFDAEIAQKSMELRVLREELQSRAIRIPDSREELLEIGKTALQRDRRNRSRMMKLNASGGGGGGHAHQQQQQQTRHHNTQRRNRENDGNNDNNKSVRPPNSAAARGQQEQQDGINKQQLLDQFLNQEVARKERTPISSQKSS